jgi:predicted DNA-binding protein (UPF0251 family)
MARPVKWRCVDFVPQATYFKPAGIPLYSMEDVRLSIEEAEAVRLKDLEGLEQEECAERMHISRPTFHRVLEAARKKLADALINGKAIRVEGGNFEMSARRFRCNNDGHEWEVPFEAMISAPSPVCPECNGLDTLPAQPKAGFGRGGCGRRRRRGGWQRQVALQGESVGGQLRGERRQEE